MPRAKLHKFVEGSDDIEAFLEGFKAITTTEKWPKNRWKGQLVTVLSGTVIPPVAKFICSGYRPLHVKMNVRHACSHHVWKLLVLCHAA